MDLEKEVKMTLTQQVLIGLSVGTIGIFLCCRYLTIVLDKYLREWLEEIAKHLKW